MIFAIIDLGTNTFNLLIGEKLPNHTFKTIFNTKIAVKLGEGSINSGYISDVPFQRGINALKQFQQYLLDYHVEHAYSFATSAIRTASNGNEFIIQAKKKAGISVTIIDGDEEADLIYHGNKMAVKLTDSISLIMDIGGGSTEFILANNQTVFWKQSFLLGAARLLEKFKLSDPLNLEDYQKFNEYLTVELNPLILAAKLYVPIELIGSSGAFDSIIDMIDGEFNVGKISKSQTEYAVQMEHYYFISKMIKASTLNERSAIKGLIDMRTDMIVISILLIDFVLNSLHLSRIRISSFSLKEGVISKKLGLTLS